MMKTHARRILRSAPAALLLFSGTLLTGCNPGLDPEKYGEIVTDLPPVEGVEKPYPLPKLEEPQKADEQDKK